MAENEINIPYKFDLSSYARAKDKMIATNDMAYRGLRRTLRERLESLHREFTPEEVANIIESGSLVEQQRLSRHYFYNNGYYKHIIIHYATLLKYMGLLIPNPSAGKNLSTSHISKRYFSAIDLVEAMHLPTWLTNCAQRALVDGCYYGVRVDTDKNSFAVLDLPAQYCCTRFKDASGNDLIEFDLSYFNTIVTEEARDAALEAFPKVVSKAYRRWSKGKGNLTSNWFIIPSDIGVCLPIFDGRPIFLSTIPAIIAYEEASDEAQEKLAEDIRKIIVQQIPHLTDGRLLFEPDEAEEIHAGTVGMLRGNKNVSVLTTYADVNAITSKTTDESNDDLLTRAEQNIYAQAGVSGQIFASTGSGTLEASLQNDLAFMMYFANKASNFITNVLNDKFGNSNITFKYQIQPISYYNDSAVIEDSFKLVGSGYSALMPALALGMTQRDIVNIKDLENDVLKLGDKLKPLSTSYTQSGSDKGDSEESSKSKEGEGSEKPAETNPDQGGRPALKEGEKTEKTIVNEESKNKTGGGS